jgi:CubicO group peptidase (beta-lactamase class C family)
MTDPTPARDYWPTSGWRTAAPEDQGLDAAQLDRAIERLGADYPHLNSLLVARGGYLVADHYRDGDPDELRNVKSVAKSVLGLLTGVALGTGDLAGVDETLGTLLPAQFTSADDPRTRAITVEHLLTMRSGLDWSEWGGSAQEMTASPNWLQFVLDRPLAHDPGARFNYSTGDTQLLSAALGEATGMTALEFADLYLFGPLGIERRRWPADPQGHTVGGAELALRPRDMAKLGLLVLERGAWAGAEIVPARWIADAIRAHAPVIPAGAGDCVRLDYGYLWWLRQQYGPAAAYESALAVGFGGQYIYVVPALDLVVVITGDLRNIPPAFRDNGMLCQFNLVQERILPAVIA